MASKKTLRLNLETVRKLTGNELHRAAGGGDTGSLPTAVRDWLDKTKSEAPFASAPSDFNCGGFPGGILGGFPWGDAIKNNGQEKSGIIACPAPTATVA